MTRVKIVGGGLTGVLAAFQAHALGATDIELHERFDHLGGAALPIVRYGLEMRDERIYFGPRGDPIRTTLETHGVEFRDFEDRCGSLNPGDLYLDGFGGPGAAGALASPAGPSLADRLACCPDDLQGPLSRHARWRLGCDLARVHASAAAPLGIDPTHPQVGRPHASLPADGFADLFRRCRRALEAIGAKVRLRDLVSPRHALFAHAPGDVLVWAADPAPLFRAAGVPSPRLLAKSVATYVLEARWTGPLPFHVQNFTAEGSCFGAYIYETGGRTLLTAECVVEDGGDELTYDIVRMLKGFEGDLTLGDLLAASIRPRWPYHTVDAVERLAELRAALTGRLGPAFVPGWDAYDLRDRFAEVGAGLAAALDATTPARAAA